VRRSRSRFGLAMSLVSGATFGTSGSFASSLIKAGWSPGAAVTVRVTIAALVLTVPAILQLRARPLTWASARTVLLYGFMAIAVAQLCYFVAVSHLSVAVALLIEYSGILLVIAWGWIRHSNRPRRLTAVAVLTALAGLVLVLDLTGPQKVDLVGALWALGAAVGLATYFIVTAESENETSPLVLAWGGLAVGAVVLALAGFSGALPFRATSANVMLLGSQVLWIVPVLGLAIVASVVAYLTGIVAVRQLGSKLASFLGLTEVLSAVLFAWLLLGQHLDATQLVGAALVVAGIALVRLDEMATAAPSTAQRRTNDAPSADLALSAPNLRPDATKGVIPQS